MYKSIKTRVTDVSILMLFLTFLFIQPVNAQMATIVTGAVINENLVTKTLYVDGNVGNDTNPGTSEQPLKTINKAANIAIENKKNNSGTKVYIKSGIYRESVDIRTNLQVIENPIIFEALDGEVIMSGSDVWESWTAIEHTNIYQKEWPYKWGLYPNPWQGTVEMSEIVRRREMVFVDGKPFAQVSDFGSLQPGTFFIDEVSEKIFLVPTSSGIDGHQVEVSIRSNVF